MTVEQALEELKKCANEFAMVGDSEQAIENNKEEFFNKYEQVKKYYQYITDNTENNPIEGIFDDIWLEACDVVGSLENNRGLDEWVEKILGGE